MLHEHHQGSGSLECEGGREREETLEGTRHSGNTEPQYHKKKMFFTMQCLLKCNRLLRFDLQKACNRAVKAGLVTGSLKE